MWRLIIGHDYENDEGRLHNDYSGQIRLNHFVSAKNSILWFVQSQNIRVLQMNHRYFLGVISPFNICNENQYFDLAAGLFYEDEKYPKLQTNKLRFNINGFIRLKFLKTCFLIALPIFKSIQKIQVISVYFLSQKSILNKTSLHCQLSHKIAIIQPYLLIKEMIFFPVVLTINLFN